MKFLSDILAKAGLTVDGVVTLNNTATGQTPDANDNSTKLATTAWVRTFVQPYSLPIASASVLGGIRVGSGLSINSGTGVLSVTGASAASIKSTQTFVVTEGQTVFTVTGGYTPGLMDIFVNGVYLSPNQTTATNGTTFTINDPAATGDIVDIIVSSPIFEGSAATTDQLPEGVVNLYYTNARARAAISLTTTGVSGAATYNSSTGVFNIPNYQGLVPAGGVAGQVLSKVDGNDYNTQWLDEAPAASYTSQLKHRVKSSQAINKGQAVYVSSADGTNMIVSKASNASEATSSKTMGLLESTVSINGTANVITEGLLAGLDTTGANAAGDPVWLGTDGNLIYGLVSKPSAPAHLVFIGVVTRRNANNGEIFVKVQNGFEMGELHDYVQNGVQDNYVISYELSTSLYKPKSIATLLGYTPANAARSLTINGTSYDLTADRTWNVGTVTSVAALTIGTSGTDITSTVANSTTTPVITLNVPDASAFARGVITTSTQTIAGGKYFSDNIAVGHTSPFDVSQFSLDVNGGLLVKNSSKTAQFVLINSNPALGGNNAFVVHTVGGSSGTSYADIQGYYGTSIAGSTVLRLNPQGGNVLIGNLAGSGSRMVVASATGVLSTQAIQTLSDLSGVPTARTLTINGVTFDLSANRTWTINSMVYPSAGIAVSTGTAWATSITDNSSNWNTAFGWGNHASAGYATTTYVNTQVANLVASAPATLDTLNELAAALGNDAAFSTTVTTALGNRLRIDTASQGLNGTQQSNGRTNLGLGSLATLSSIGDAYITDLAYSKLTGVPSTFAPSAHTHDDRYYTETEIGNFFSGASAITGYNKTNWDTAYGWGNHASGGYLTTASAASTYVSLSGSYANPSWITSLAYSKITGVPAFITSYTEVDTLATVTGRGATTTAAITVTASEGREVAVYMPSSYTTDDLVSGHEYGWYNDHWRLGMTRSGGAAGADFVVQWNAARRLSLTSGGNLTVTGTISSTNFSGSSSGTNTGDQTNISGNAATATNVAWTGVTGRPTALSSFTNDLGNYGGWITSYTETDTLASVTGRGASTSTAISINNTLTVTSGRIIARTGGVNTYGVFSGYDNSNHMMTFRASVTGDTSSPTFTAVHQTTFIEFAEANDITGWYFKSASTGTYQEIARITRTGINWNGNTVLHTGNYTSTLDGRYFFDYGFTEGYPGTNANSMPGNRSAFTYSNGSPYTGPIAHFGAAGYGLQLNANYGDGTLLGYRVRNGDNATWSSWRRIVWEGGTWSFNITGSAGSLSSMNISQFTNNSGYVTGGPYLPLSGGTLTGTLGLPNAALISVNNEPDVWGARFRTTASTTNLGAGLKNIIWTGGGSTEGFAVTGSGTGGASFEVRNDGRGWFKGDLTVQSNMYVSADGSSGYVASRIWLYSHNNYRGAGIYLSGTGSTWFAGTGYTDFDGTYIISRRSVAGDDSTAWSNYRLWQVSSSGSTYQTGSISAEGTINSASSIYATAATARIQAGSTSSADILYDSSRSALVARGNYPHVEIFSEVSNSNHGGTLRFTGYDNGSSGAYKSWNIGAPGSDLYFLDFAYGGTSNSNPHAGIAGLGTAYSYPGAFNMMRLHNNGNVGIGNFGTYGSEGNTPAFKLDVRGTGRFTGALSANTSLTVGGGGDALAIAGAEGRITFRDQALVWTGYVGFRGNLGVIEYPGRNVQISCGYNGYVEINTGTNDYLSGRLTVPFGSVNARRGFTSESNPWGTADSSFHPNGITTAGSTNWIYGLTYLGNAPSNGSGAEVAANGRSYFRSSNASGTWGYAGQFVDRSNAANNYIPWSFESEYGNHSWGIVARFHIQGTSTDRPAIQFTNAISNTRWSVGYCFYDDNFRITQNQGYRTDGSAVSDGWGTERFRINTDGVVNTFNKLNIGSTSGRTVSIGDGTYANHILCDSNVDFAFNYNNSSTGGFGFFGGTASAKFMCSNAGTLTVSGDVVAYGSPSDARLKDIKEKVPNALDSILKLNGYRFDWKERELDVYGDDKKILHIKEDIGVIAQEVADVLPELAKTNEDGFMSVRYQGLTAVLIEAVKEQQTQIESQKSEIEELKDLVKQLINR